MFDFVVYAILFLDKVKTEGAFIMKAIYHATYILPAKKEKTSVRMKMDVNDFFGLETKRDQLWFYGFYATSFVILTSLVIISAVMDAVNL